MVYIIFGGGEFLIEKTGRIVFNGDAGFAPGFSMRVGGNLVLGDHFGANKNCFISCSKEIVIGEQVQFGWNCSVRDSDGHTVYVNGEPKVSKKKVVIGNHCWICAEAHITKGALMGNDSILAYRSLLLSGSDESNVLWAGHPAKAIEHNVNWGDYIEEQQIAD